MNLCLRLLATPIMLAAMAGLALADPARVTTDLNLRAGPGTQFRVITVIPRNSHADVRTCRGSWCAVSYRGLSGYASARYLAPVRRRTPVPPPVMRPPIVVPPSVVAPRPPAVACDGRGASWAVGLPASPGIIERARAVAHALRVRVIRPGEFYTQEFDRHRLTLELNEDRVIIDVRCG